LLTTLFATETAEDILSAQDFGFWLGGSH